MPKTQFQNKLSDWYQRHKRDLPWREIKDPYRIWLSEIILQQTRVDQGMPYYEKFIKNYPSIHDLAEAGEDQVLKDWEGLGYYTRARNLHATSKYVSNELNGKFPDTYDDLLNLKGVGEYTAAAIGSFAFGIPRAVVDGNVFRLLARYHGIDIPVNTTSGKKEFTRIANEMLDKDDPAAYNQAIMEFGSRQCTPVNPDCKSCPLNKDCKAYNNGTVGQLPVKLKKNYDRKRYFNYLLFYHNGKILIHQRGEKDIWRKLYQFFLVETEKEANLDEIMREARLFINNQEYVMKNHHKLDTHKLSHQSIYITITEIEIEAVNGIAEEWGKWVPVSQHAHYAFPRPLRKYLDRIQLTLPLE